MSLGTVRRGLPFLIAILALALLGAVVVQVRVVRTVAGGEDVPDTIDTSGGQVQPPPKVERLTDPHALLVLDVSGSMEETSDPGHLQSEAVKRFYEVYRDLSREILGKGESAKLGIVLFSTIAQIIDWDGKRNPWLDVNEKNTRVLEDVVKRHLGEAGETTRLGQDTDHLSALQVVDSLVSKLQTPPAVIFMTDGQYFPHPFFTPMLSNTDREAISSYAEHRSEVEPYHRGKGRFLRARAAQPIFNRQGTGVNFNPWQEGLPGTVSEEIKSRRDVILRKRFRLSQDNPRVPPLWAPVFLGDDAVVGVVKHVLANTNPSAFWAGQKPFIHCKSPDQMTGEFIRVLSQWFRLTEIDVESGATRIHVPPETQAFAVHLNMDRDVGTLKLRSASGEVRLSGRGRVRAGVATGDGAWHLESGGGTVQAGKLYLRPRYDWVLNVPESVRWTGAEQTFNVDLFLFSLKGREEVLAGGVFDGLPAELPVHIEQPGGRTASVTAARYSEAVQGDPAYRAVIPLSGVSGGHLTVSVDLSAMQKLVPTRSGVLRKTINLAPGVRIVMRDSRGNNTYINVKRVPRESERLREIWERTRARFGV